MSDTLAERAEKARAAAKRLVCGAFRRDGELLEGDDRPRFSIPCRPEHDDDTSLMKFIDDVAAANERLERELVDTKKLADTYQQSWEAVTRVREILNKHNAPMKAYIDERVEAVITALAAANARLERERDEMRSTAAGVTLAMTKQRDAATSALAKAERERDRMQEGAEEALGCLNAAFAEGWAEALAEENMERIHDLWGRRISFAVPALEAALTPAPEAPNAAVREAGSALWTEDHRQKMAQEASAILDEMRQGAPKDGE